MSKLKLGIIIGTTRPNRFADKPAQWIAERARATGEFEVEIVDLRDYKLPFFDEQASPAWAPSKAEGAKAWQEKIASLDCFIATAAEYNRAPSGVLKNALDYAYNEWNNKAIGFVGYGGVGGARAIEQLRVISVELQMAPVRNGVHILWPDYMQIASGEKEISDFEHLNEAADGLIKQLAWWGKALKVAREAA